MADTIYFVVPGSLSIRTGGYNYDRKIIEGLRARGTAVELVELGGHYPDASEEDRAAAGRLFASIPDGTPTIVDGLAFGALPEIAEKEQARLRLVALVHHPLADEAGLSKSTRARLIESEMRALRRACGIIVTSAYTKRRLAEYGVAPERVSVVMPGTDEAAIAKGSGGEGLSILCPASYIPRKGHADLFHALSGLENLSWRLLCVGEKSLAPDHFASLCALCVSLGLSDRIEMRNQVADAELNRLYAVSDLVALASLYEGFGMVVTEALMRGLPVVTTTGGALADTLPAGAGLASAPGDIDALRENLRIVLTDRAAYARLREGARAARDALPRWSEAVAAFETALRTAARR